MEQYEYYMNRWQIGLKLVGASFAVTADMKNLNRSIQCVQSIP